MYHPKLTRLVPDTIASVVLAASAVRATACYLFETVTLPFTDVAGEISGDSSMPGAFVDSTETDKTKSEMDGASSSSLRALFVDAAICEMLANDRAGEGEPTRPHVPAGDSARRIQDKLFSKTDAQSLKKRICNEINNETRRCRHENERLSDALQSMLNRVISAEMEQIKLHARMDEAIVQREKDMTATINELRIELASAIASLERSTTLSSSKLTVMQLQLDECKATIGRWTANEKRQAAEAARKKAEAEVRRRQEAEEKARREKIEEEERRQKAARADKVRKWKETLARWAREEEARRQKGWYQSAQEKHKEAMLARWEQYTTPLGVELTFDTIIWPVLEGPKRLFGGEIPGLTLEAIRDFLLSDLHSKGRTPRQRLNDALLRWHSDKKTFVIEELADPKDEKLVSDAFHTISVHLNKLKSMPDILNKKSR
ncbi:unnamed protein product [Peniophora sp. CBMAI 1063]|nr:unnamed protein product [Peniophora sp. CBMAI 1063]